MNPSTAQLPCPAPQYIHPTPPPDTHARTLVVRKHYLGKTNERAIAQLVCTSECRRCPYAMAAGVPTNLRRQLVWWVGGTAAWVYTMVVLGGVTRLTRSGLSMTDWKFTGARVFPPVVTQRKQLTLNEH